MLFRSRYAGCIKRIIQALSAESVMLLRQYCWLIQQGNIHDWNLYSVSGLFIRLIDSLLAQNYQVGQNQVALFGGRLQIEGAPQANHLFDM